MMHKAKYFSVFAHQLRVPKKNHLLWKNNVKIHLSRWISVVFCRKNEHPGEWGRKSNCVHQPILLITNQCESIAQTQEIKFSLTHLWATQSTWVGCFMSPKTAHTSTLQAFIHIFKMHNFNSNNGGGGEELESKSKLALLSMLIFMLHWFPWHLCI